LLSPSIPRFVALTACESLAMTSTTGAELGTLALVIEDAQWKDHCQCYTAFAAKNVDVLEYNILLGITNLYLHCCRLLPRSSIDYVLRPFSTSGLATFSDLASSVACSDVKTKFAVNDSTR